MRWRSTGGKARPIDGVPVLLWWPSRCEVGSRDGSEWLDNEGTGFAEAPHLWMALPPLPKSGQAAAAVLPAGSS